MPLSFGGSVVLSTLLQLLPVVASAGQQKEAGKTTSAPPVTPPRLEIRLAASRSELPAGGSIGITGTLTNISTDSTLYLTQQSVTLMLPPELEPGGAVSWPALFPTELQVDGNNNYIPNDAVVLALRPGQSMTVAWSPTRESPESSAWLRLVRTYQSEMQFLFFTPGDYQISVQAKYWTSAQHTGYGYLTATQSIPVRVLAPQFVILFGAAIGGLIAYIVFPSRRIAGMVSVDTSTSFRQVRQAVSFMFWVQKHLGAAFLAMLWSAVVTILLSRLSETQLPIRVTVADFWGAIAIGLLAQYAGSKWLERLFQAEGTVTQKVETTVTPRRRQGPESAIGALP